MVRGVFQITLLLLACSFFATGDVAHLKATKAKLLSRLAGKHHKRGIYSAVPPFKLGHDIPLVTHSVVKPLVVTYPPTAAVAAVKVPVFPPLPNRFPVSVGHRVHPHIGFKYPHHTKTVVVPNADQHFHHHHHHVAPKPLVPVLPAPPAIPATPVVPLAQAGAIAHNVPAPSPSVLVHQTPQHVLPPQPLPVAAPPTHIHNAHIPLRQLVPLPSIQAASGIPEPLPIAPQFPYVIRPGNAVQTSYFATYPRYPFLNYQNSLLPLPASAAPVLPSSVSSTLLFDHPHYQHLLPQLGVQDGVIEQHVPGVPLEPTPSVLHATQPAIPQPTIHLEPSHPTVHVQPSPPAVHLHPTQPTVHLQPSPGTALDHDGWSPVTHGPAHPPEAHFPQPVDTHHFTQEQGNQVYEHHSGNEYHDYQDQLQLHLQQQLEQAQYEQHLSNHQLGQDYGQNNDYSQQNQDFAQHAEEYAQRVQEYAQHEQNYAQTNEYSQQQQEYGVPQPGQEYGAPQPGQEYGPPQQGFEGRSGEGDGETQRYHNHIPLGLQPPIDRPLENFR